LQGEVRFGVEASVLVRIICSGNNEPEPTFDREDVATFVYSFTVSRYYIYCFAVAADKDVDVASGNEERRV
jgi:hypothetical protein